MLRLSGGPATPVATPPVTKGDRAELERLVLVLERQHPDWSAREIELELAQRAPASHGSWAGDTPNLRARLRQVQRWRTGAQSRRRTLAHPAYTFLWPLGEKQRQVIEPAFTARASPRSASHRIFLHNCSAETVRELRARLGRVEVAYEPALAAGGFTELHWTRNPAIRDSLLGAADHQLILYSLDVEFAVSNGTRRAFLKGELSLDSSDGWISFRTSEQSAKEIE